MLLSGRQSTERDMNANVSDAIDDGVGAGEALARREDSVTA